MKGEYIVENKICKQCLKVFTKEEYMKGTRARDSFWQKKEYCNNLCRSKYQSEKWRKEH